MLYNSGKSTDIIICAFHAKLILTFVTLNKQQKTGLSFLLCEMSSVGCVNFVAASEHEGSQNDRIYIWDALTCF
jgi:hypothetical protein